MTVWGQDDPRKLTCPCGTGRPYGDCCRPLHEGAPAPTAETLMRARYSAFALGETDFLFRSWHPRTRPDDVTPTPGRRWTGLTVLRTVEGGETDDHGVVEFEAAYSTTEGSGVQRETSRFERRRGTWVYVDAEG